MNLKLAILRNLVLFGDNAAEQSILLLQLRTGGNVGENAFQDALAELKDQGLIRKRIDDLTQDAYWLITPAGKNKLRSL
jgi:DNA-binding PadR family transcriptional regulator